MISNHTPSSLEYFTLIAVGVEAGREYRLQVARVDVVRPEPPVLTLHELQLPKVLRAGQTVRSKLTFALDKAGMADSFWYHYDDVDDHKVVASRNGTSSSASC